MTCLRIRFRSPRSTADRISDVLQEYGAFAVSIENAGGHDCFDTAFPAEPDWTEVYVAGLYQPGTVSNCITDAFNRHLPALRPLPVTVEEFTDAECLHSWTRGYGPVQVCERLWVCPS